MYLEVGRVAVGGAGDSTGATPGAALGGYAGFQLTGAPRLQSPAVAGGPRAGLHFCQWGALQAQGAGRHHHAPHTLPVTCVIKQLVITP